MARRDKRLAALRVRPRQVRFAELQAVLRDFGFAERAGKGDHRVFVHPSLSYPVAVDPRRPFVLPVYVRNVLRAVAELQAREEPGGEEDE